MPDAPTAAVLLIGNEVLSGRTKDKNLGFIADYLTAMGIDLKEARVVADEMDDIAAAVNALRSRYTYVFTTGGIGPTHDDITADAMGQAFGVTVDHDPRAKKILLDYFAEIGREANEARLRMARVPLGASLIENAVSKAPGFRMENVFVMAGVPKVMQSMMDAIAPTLSRGTPVQSVTVNFLGGEGDIAKPLGEVQDRFPQLSIGSYPYESPTGFATNLVVRGRDVATVEAAAVEVEKAVASLCAGGKGRGWSRT